jgi:hippurate hydrolase
LSLIISLVFNGIVFSAGRTAQAQESFSPEFSDLAPTERVVQAKDALTFAQGMQPTYLNRLVELVDQDSDRLTNIFKDIHQNPELGFMETRTAEIVAKNLEALGYEVKTGIGKTGVVGILRNGEGPTVMFRADMDANAVEEDTGLPYASTVRVLNLEGEEVPVMHACGHDAHTTWMLGLAKVMVEMKSDWSGTLILVAQPAEEPILGAQAMVDDGLYTTHGVPVPDVILSAHTAPGPLGVVANAPGTRMAGTDQLDVVFKGIGGHGSNPQFTKDPIVMVATAIMQYQLIVSRAISPLDAAVLTVGSVLAGADNNVIPSEALAKINLRWFNEQDRETLIRGIKAINESNARAFGMPEDQWPTIKFKGSSTPLVNDEVVVNQINPALAQLVGEGNLIDNIPATTGSEDAHLLKGDNPNVLFDYVLIGVADPDEFAQARAQGKAVPYSNHNPDFRVDLKAIPFGTKVVSVMTLEMFEQ